MTAGDAPLAGQIALVTGAGRGIGRTIARAYADAGAHVVVASRTATELDALVAEIENTGGAATSVPTDVTVPEAVEQLFARIDDVGGLDLVMLNAGGLPGRGPVADSDLASWNDTISLNLTAAYLCARAAIPRLRARGGGRIILVGSGIGHRGVPEFSAYACAKAGQWMLTRVLAQELQADAISVNELIPGPVRTDIGTGDFGSAATKTFAGEWSKTPDDVVPLALMLATQPNHGPSAQSFSLMRRDN
jgi:3-oxoacyl-[acyl-carrier protein] reductase